MDGRNVTTSGVLRVESSVRILIVDDNVLFTEGLKLLLGQQSDFRVIGHAVTVTEAIDATKRDHPDVILVDILLPDGNSANLIEAVRAFLPHVQFLLLRGEGNMSILSDAVDAGACGILGKSITPQQMYAAIRRAAKGDNLLSPAVLKRLAEFRAERNEEEAERMRYLSLLTPREREVLMLSARGLDSAALAEHLNLSIHTVRGYVQSMIEKLETSSKLEAVAKAGACGIIRYLQQEEEKTKASTA